MNSISKATGAFSGAARVSPIGSRKASSEPSESVFMSSASKF